LSFQRKWFLQMNEFRHPEWINSFFSSYLTWLELLMKIGDTWSLWESSHWFCHLTSWTLLLCRDDVDQTTRDLDRSAELFVLPVRRSHTTADWSSTLRLGSSPELLYYHDGVRFDNFLWLGFHDCVFHPGIACRRSAGRHFLALGVCCSCEW
jgi:hypothetical protein